MARLDDHASDPEKARVFTTVRVLHLVDRTPLNVINAIEGRCADLLGLRGAMGPRQWPLADNWLALVA